MTGGGSTLRLVWPQWQGAGTSSVEELAAEFPLEVARRGYVTGSAVLDAVLPPHDGPTARVPIEVGDLGMETVDGIEAKRVVVDVADVSGAADVVGLTIAEFFPRQVMAMEQILGGFPLIGSNRPRV